MRRLSKIVVFFAACSAATVITVFRQNDGIRVGADNQLRAVISVRMSPFSEMVNIEVVKYLVTEAIPA